MVNFANFGETYTDNIRVHKDNYTVLEIEELLPGWEPGQTLCRFESIF